MKRFISAFLLIGFVFTVASAVPIDPTAGRVEEPAPIKSKVHLSNKDLRKLSAADVEKVMGREMTETEKSSFTSHKKKFVKGMEEYEVKKTNTLAILSFVGVFLGPVAIVLGIIALGQIKKRDEAGRGWAIAGIVIGALVTLLFLGVGIMGAGGA